MLCSCILNILYYIIIKKFKKRPFKILFIISNIISYLYFYWDIMLNYTLIYILDIRFGLLDEKLNERETNVFYKMVKIYI